MMERILNNKNMMRFRVIITTRFTPENNVRPVREGFEPSVIIMAIFQEVRRAVSL
jgi:hypothetical protein